MQVVTVNPKVQGGVPCFAGTRVPAVSLFDHLIRGCTIDEFLADFPSVQREQVAGLLDMAKLDVPAHAELVWSVVCGWWSVATFSYRPLATDNRPLSPRI